MDKITVGFLMRGYCKVHGSDDREEVEKFKFKTVHQHAAGGIFHQ